MPNVSVLLQNSTDFWVYSPVLARLILSQSQSLCFLSSLTHVCVSFFCLFIMYICYMYIQSVQLYGLYVHTDSKKLINLRKVGLVDLNGVNLGLLSVVRIVAH